MASGARAGGKSAGLRDWRVLYWLIAEAVSLAGDTVFFLVLAWTSIQQAGPTGAGLVLAAAAIPRAALMILGGAFADRVGARRIAVASDVVRCALLLAAAAAATVGTPMAFLLALGVIFGVFDAVFVPASGSLAPLVVGTDQLVRVQSLRTLGNRGALVGGALLGGVLIASVSVSLSLVLDSATFALSAVALARLKVLPVERPDAELATAFANQVLVGLRYVGSQPMLRNLLMIVALFEFSVNGVSNIGFPTLAAHRGWNSAAFGLLVAAVGAGAAGSALVLAILARTPAPGLLVGLAGLLGAGVTAAFPFVPALPADLLLAFALGVAGGLIGGVALPIVQAGTPASHLGRVMSLFAIATVGTAPFSLAIAALVIRQAGLPVAFVGAAVLAVAGAASCLTSRALRAAELPAARPLAARQLSPAVEN